MNEKVVSIVLIEDDEIDVMNLKRAFRKNNIKNPLHIANNGIEGLNLLKDKENPIANPKIILLDLNMPKMGGIEFLKEIRQDDELKHLIVYVMTTSNVDNDKIEAYNLNVAGYILKPLSMEKFIEAVATLKSFWQLCEYPS